MSTYSPHILNVVTGVDGKIPTLVEQIVEEEDRKQAAKPAERLSSLSESYEFEEEEFEEEEDDGYGGESVVSSQLVYCLFIIPSIF